MTWGGCPVPQNDVRRWPPTAMRALLHLPVVLGHGVGPQRLVAGKMCKVPPTPTPGKGTAQGALCSSAVWPLEWRPRVTRVRFPLLTSQPGGWVPQSSYNHGHLTSSDHPPAPWFSLCSSCNWRCSLLPLKVCSPDQ